MRVTHSYRGWSAFAAGSGGRRIAHLAANLARSPVAFDAEIRDVIRFREAVSALHDVVVSDLAGRRDPKAYAAWKAAEAERLRKLEWSARASAVAEPVRRPVPAELAADHAAAVKRYWKARLRFNDNLVRTDPALWRSLTPCDPIVTVASDAVLFECFSADGSSYGCLSASRHAFAEAGATTPGTTNVDFSWRLFDEFRTLRTYRATRLRVDPLGVEAQGGGGLGVREEKIDLPDGWLRGFLQVQTAMGLPMRRVRLSREALHSILAWLRRHRERGSPRAIRFELTPGQAPVVVLEPWEVRIVSLGTRYDGPPGGPVRVWGRRRLTSLARLLPFADSVDVHLLGTGLPHFWLVRMGSAAFTLGLSGWTRNDWTQGSAMDLLAAPASPGADVILRVADALRRSGRASFAELDLAGGRSAPATAAALRHLAETGQSIHDLAEGVYRWRQVLPVEVGESELGPEPPEVTGARGLRPERVTRTTAPDGSMTVRGEFGGKHAAAVTDRDGAIRGGDCSCSHHFRAGIRNGPCRHLIALRREAMAATGAAQITGRDPLTSWYESIRQWAG